VFWQNPHSKKENLAPCPAVGHHQTNKAANLWGAPDWKKLPVPKCAYTIYSGKERTFISTSKGKVRLCNSRDEENEDFFFFFLEKSVVK
jgi:hypothetical protein